MASRAKTTSRHAPGPRDGRVMIVVMPCQAVPDRAEIRRYVMQQCSDAAWQRDGTTHRFTSGASLRPELIS